MVAYGTGRRYRLFVEAAEERLRFDDAVDTGLLERLLDMVEL